MHEEKGSGRPPPPLDKGMLPFPRRRTAAIFVPRQTRRRTDASLGGRPPRLGDSPDGRTVQRSVRAPSFGPREEYARLSSFGPKEECARASSFGPKEEYARVPSFGFEDVLLEDISF